MSINSSTNPPLRAPKTIPTHSSNGALLPGLLCLHGSGSNSSVFKLQTRRLLWILSSHFRFVFVQAPHDAVAGTGMLPVFESCAPFYKWSTVRWVAGAEKEVTPQGEVEELDALLKRVMEENGGVDSFVGVLGFSAGARLVGGLLLRQGMMGREECWTKFRFGVAVGGPWPPMCLYEGEDGLDVGRDYGLLKEVPLVVAWGKDDVYREAIVKMADMCEGELCYRFEFAGGHHLPLTDQGARELCGLIMKAWNRAGGEEAVSVEETV